MKTTSRTRPYFAVFVQVLSIGFCLSLSWSVWKGFEHIVAPQLTAVDSGLDFQ